MRTGEVPEDSATIDLIDRAGAVIVLDITRDNFNAALQSAIEEVSEEAGVRFDAKAIRRAWGIGPGHVVIGTVARLFRNKGYEDLIPAMARAAARQSSLRFVWIGDGANFPA